MKGLRQEICKLKDQNENMNLVLRTYIKSNAKQENIEKEYYLENENAKLKDRCAGYSKV